MPFSEASGLVVLLEKLSRLLAEQETCGYVVGGFIRDWVLMRQTHDIDIAVRGDAIRLAEKIARSLSGKFVLLDADNGIARIIAVQEQEQWQVDFSSLEGDIEADLARRDFTIDAMAIELADLILLVKGKRQEELELVDPFGGRKDVEEGIVRAVSEQVFEADPIRLLRAARLAAELDFSIEPETENLIRRYHGLVARVPGERVREELLRLLCLPGSARFLRYLDELSLLTVLIPELDSCKGVDQPTTHFWDVFDHSLEAMAAVEFLTRENSWQYAGREMLTSVPWSQEIEDSLSRQVSAGSTHRSLLKLACLLHDIAKPETKFVDPTGRARFYGHTGEGAIKAKSILGRLRMSHQETKQVETMVYHHLHPVQMANEGCLPTRRAIYRYFRDTGDNGIDILFLALADYLATCGPNLTVEGWQEQCRMINYILAEHGEQQERISPVKIIDGHDLIDVFGLSPGPLLGRLLVQVQEARASGELKTKEEALALVRKELSVRNMFDNHTEQRLSG
jgi:poly(A) polymerase